MYMHMCMYISCTVPNQCLPDWDAYVLGTPGVLSFGSLREVFGSYVPVFYTYIPPAVLLCILLFFLRSPGDSKYVAGPVGIRTQAAQPMSSAVEMSPLR